MVIIHDVASLQFYCIELLSREVVHERNVCSYRDSLTFCKVVGIIIVLSGKYIISLSDSVFSLFLIEFLVLLFLKAGFLRRNIFLFAEIFEISLFFKIEKFVRRLIS